MGCSQLTPALGNLAQGQQGEDQCPFLTEILTDC